MRDHTLSNSMIVTALALIVAFAAFAGPSGEPAARKAAPDRINPVAGEKLDSGLGDVAPWRPEAPAEAKVAAAQ